MALQERLKVINSARQKVLAENAVEGISLTVEERELTAAALEFAGGMLEAFQGELFGGFK